MVDNLGDVTITNDGKTILDEMEVDHPTAKLMVQLAKSQDEKVGDGTTSVVLLAGTLLKIATELLDQDVHATIISKGYNMAMLKAVEALDGLATQISSDDHEVLKKLAITSMNSKVVGGDRDYLADICVDAATMIKEMRNEEIICDIKNIQIIKKPGKSMRETKLVKGLIVDKEVVSQAMPTRIEDAKIALIDAAMEIKKTEFDSEVKINAPSQMQAFLDEEEVMLGKMVDYVKNAGANVIFCQKGIDDDAQNFLAQAGILAARRCKKSDMDKLARATGARVVSSLRDLTESDLGSAGLVEERKVGKDSMIYIEDCNDPKAVSILIRAGTEHVTEELDRAMHDALCVVIDAIQNPSYVPGGGAVESELAKVLRAYKDTVSGREQVAIELFADALEVIPITLAENAGLDPVNVIVELRSKHKDGEVNAGIDVMTGRVEDMIELGVIQPKVVTEQILRSASEAACMIVRIDDVISMRKSGGGPGGPGGAGGGPEMGEDMD
jgi:thermosome